MQCRHTTWPYRGTERPQCKRKGSWCVAYTGALSDTPDPAQQLGDERVSDFGPFCKQHADKVQRQLLFLSHLDNPERAAEHPWTPRDA